MIKNNYLWLELAAHVEKLQAENDALKEQVAQKEVEVKHLLGKQLLVEQELTSLQSKSAALVEALETVKRYLSVGNATSAYNYIFVALAAFDGEK